MTGRAATSPPTMEAGREILRLRAGGVISRRVRGFLVDLFGQDLIIVASRRHMIGRASIAILASWICAAFRRTLSTITNRGGLRIPYCTCCPIGTGRDAKA